MNRQTLLERALWGLTAALVVVAVASLLWRPAVPRGATPPAALAGPRAAPGQPGARGSEAADAIVAANVFSSSRAAPAERYVPYGSEPESAPAEVEEYSPPAPESEVAETGGEAVPRLYGTVVGPRGTSALMRLDAASPEARLYREGDQENGYEVVKINAQSVILSGPRGTIEVPLLRPEDATR